MEGLSESPGQGSRIGTNGVEPHLVDVSPVLVLWQLNTPLPTILIRGVLPCRDNVILNRESQLSSSITTPWRIRAPTDFEQVVISFLR